MGQNKRTSTKTLVKEKLDQNPVPKYFFGSPSEERKKGPSCESLKARPWLRQSFLQWCKDLAAGETHRKNVIEKKFGIILYICKIIKNVKPLNFLHFFPYSFLYHFHSFLLPPFTSHLSLPSLFGSVQIAAILEAIEGHCLKNFHDLASKSHLKHLSLLLHHKPKFPWENHVMLS